MLSPWHERKFSQPQWRWWVPCHYRSQATLPFPFLAWWLFFCLLKAQIQVSRSHTGQMKVWRYLQHSTLEGKEESPKITCSSPHICGWLCYRWSLGRWPSYGRPYKRIWNARHPKLETKHAVDKSVVLAVLLCGCESRTLYCRHVKLQDKFHQRYLRRILTLTSNGTIKSQTRRYFCKLKCQAEIHC